MKKILAIIMLLVLSAVSCTTAADGTRKISKTGIGTGIGAAAGAVIGQAIGKDTKGTLIGTAGGAAVGAVIGNIFDRQEKELKEKLSGTGVKVVRTGEGEIKLVAPENITFDTNSYIVKSQFKGTVRSIADTLKAYPDSKIIVSGHTDNTGNDAINDPLSVNRANAVANLLQEDGVSNSRITSTGYGSRNPVATNTTAAGRQQNRRVEINIVANQK
ncbi:OmpA family protein [Leptotrichia sp. oral taxon 847]|uniref:OmpA family protein n=1 Tax=Leptotrichia sp. oral taxon 847 TaxID=1785996 RepID=UPI000768213C|nr:OmpA family protein [Leptotrichia sp. oral taxon 847]AMD94524.1 hypothetical protein AXF11_02210 [Leptotrichia sp. oral taxon 847]